MSTALLTAAVAATAVLLASSGARGLVARRRARCITDRLPLPRRRPPALVAMPVGGVRVHQVLGRLVARLVERRQRERSDRALLAWLDAAARSVRAGASLRQALAEVGPVVAGHPPPSDLVLLGAELRRGDPLEEALGRFVARGPTPTRLLAGRSISLAGETGGRPAQLLDGVAATVRDRLALGREARALATQARASAVVIVAAPVAFAFVGISIDGRVASFLGSVPGLACAVVGLLLEVAGACWMARLVGRCA